MDKPGRIPVVMIAMVLFMVGAIMFGEGNKQLKNEKAQPSNPQTVQPAAAEIPTPIKAAEPAPAAP